jgi:4-hydroxy-tetrahydrodipicolinate synthase
MTSRERFRGTGVALVTPFEEDGSLDLDAYARHVELMVGGGVEMLVPCGTTGECVTLSPEERQRVIATTAGVAGGRLPVVAGAGTNDTREAVALAEAARDAGADAILSVCPYYNRPPQEGLYRHFKAVAEAAEIPVLLCNEPGRTSVNLTADTVLRLAEIPNVVGIEEGSGDLEQVASILARRPEGFLVLSGGDECALPMLALGADGLVSVVANEAPRDISDMVRLGLDGDFARARLLHFQLLELMRANLVETNPVPVKKGVELLGGPPARYRWPLTGPTEATEMGLVRALTRARLLTDTDALTGLGEAAFA